MSQNILPAFFSLQNEKAQAGENLTSLLSAFQPGNHATNGIFGMPVVSGSPLIGEIVEPVPTTTPGNAPYAALAENSKPTSTPPPGLFSNQGLTQTHHQNQNSQELLAHLMNGAQRGEHRQ
jgi:hypothetical protein